MKPKVYVIPGFGMNERHLRGLKFDGYQVEVLEWESISTINTYQEYAEKVFYPKIDREKPSIIVGYSMGGMVAVELAEMIHAKKLILISSAKNRNELPQKKLTLIKILGGKRLGTAKMLKRLTPLAKMMGKEYFGLLQASLKDIPEGIISFGIEAMIHWDRIDDPSIKYLHIHGKKDRLLPIKHVSNKVILPYGHFLLSGSGIKRVNERIERFLN